jgi:hypothetical protein
MKTKSLRACSHLAVAEPPLRLDRAVEMLVHAYDYVRKLDPHGKSGAADLLLGKYRELEPNQQQRPKEG